MKILLTFVLATWLGLGAGATAQFPDKIIYKGKEYSLYSNPLESYFD
jgi:hypothetical protein